VQPQATASSQQQAAKLRPADKGTDEVMYDRTMQRETDSYQDRLLTESTMPFKFFLWDPSWLSQRWLLGALMFFVRLGRNILIHAEKKRDHFCGTQIMIGSPDFGASRRETVNRY
jgi:hypothetical protein